MAARSPLGHGALLAALLLLCSGHTAAAATAALAPLSEALTTCLLTEQDVKQADYTAIKTACNSTSPLETLCTACTCALFTSLQTTLQSKGYDLRGAQITTDEAQQAISQCLDIVLPELQAQGVDLNAIEELTSCPDARPICA